MVEAIKEKARAFTPKQLVGLILAIVCFAVTYNIPGNEVLSHEGITAIGVLFSAVFMWFCGTMSTGVVGLCACLALFVSGTVPEFGKAFSGYTTTTTWFILGVYCMTALMQMSSLGTRITKRFILMAGADSSRLVLAIMAVTGLVSFVMTDTGAVALSLSFVLPLLGIVGAVKGKSNLGKCLLLGVSFAALLGGFATPIGHSLNVLGAGLLTSATGEEINFLKWIAYGVPVSVVSIATAWFCLVKAFPPEPITQEKIDELMENQFKTGKFTAHDYKCLVLVIGLPVLWVLGNWVPIFNSTSVALLGMILMFVPGMNICSWKDFESMASWNLFLFFGGILSIGAAIQSTGAAAYIADLFLNSGIMNIPMLASFIIVGIVLYLLHTVCPISPAWVTILLPPLITYAVTVGVDPFVPTFMLVSIIAGSYLVPLCPAMNMTYDTGWYTFGETAKGGWILSIVFVVFDVLWCYALAVLIGL